MAAPTTTGLTATGAGIAEHALRRWEVAQENVAQSGKEDYWPVFGGTAAPGQPEHPKGLSAVFHDMSQVPVVGKG
ncbi:MAG: hypothetical protein KKH70_20475, partial [Gammaproteobacteria bacterium]|nr:hypothetical protein [Gammaproteobacteria bacterium]